MQLQKAKREQVKLRLGISGASGFGKTYSSLLLAQGLTGDFSKIAVIDTENGSANLYSHLGSYNILSLKAPFSPEAYIKAIETCETAGMEVIVIDSISHEWNGKGGCLEIHERLGGRFQDWGKVTPRHQAFIDKILNSSAHIITTTRRKTDYAMDTLQNGRTKVVKLGTKEITRDGYEYELTINFELINENHLAKASKDRTGLFMNKPEFVINPSTGKKLLNWSRNQNEADTARTEIKRCSTIEELRHIYSRYHHIKSDIEKDILDKKAELSQPAILPITAIINNQKPTDNGDHIK